MEEQWIIDLRNFVCDPPDPSELWASVPSPYAGHKWDEERHLFQKAKQAYFFSKESQSVAGKKGGKTTKEKKKGIFDPDYDRTPVAKLAGKLSTGGMVCRDNQLGFHSLPKDIVDQFRKKGREQKYRCLVTGYISNACGLSNYQKGRGINYKDKSLREKVM
jgi:hypothetical protein